MFLSKIKSFFLRKIVVVRAHPDYDIAHIIIDPRDSSRQEFFLSRNELFNIASYCRRIVQDNKLGPRWTDVAFIIDYNEFQQTKITLPNWGADKFYCEIERLALSFGWDGGVPTPSFHHPFRSGYRLC